MFSAINLFHCKTNYTVTVLSGKAGNIGEFNVCWENVREVTQKIFLGKMFNADFTFVNMPVDCFGSPCIAYFKDFAAC